MIAYFTYFQLGKRVGEGFRSADKWRDETYIFLKVEGGVVHEGLDHSHEVDEQGEVVLSDVDAYALGDEGAEARQHLRQAGIL